MGILYDSVSSKGLLSPYYAAHCHFSAAISRKLDLPLTKRIGHLAAAALNAIPLLNNIVWSAEKAIFGPDHTYPLIQLDKLSPFKRGEGHGRLYKEPIQRLYREFALPMIRQFEEKHGRDCFREGEALLDHMSPALRQELVGLASGADIPYRDVVCVNTFLSVFPEESACSAVSMFVTSETVEVLGIGNGGPRDSVGTRLEKAALRTLSPIEAIRVSAENHATIQTTIFDPGRGRILVSASDHDATTSPYQTVSLDKVFDGTYVPSHAVGKVVSRNLDWKAPFLAHETILLKRDNVLTVTFPGLITGLTAINRYGVNISILQNYGPPRDCPEAVEISLACYEILQTAKNAEEASWRLQALEHAGPFHLMISDPKTSLTLTHKVENGVSSFEIAYPEHNPHPDIIEKQLKEAIAQFLESHPTLSQAHIDQFFDEYQELGYSLKDLKTKTDIYQALEPLIGYRGSIIDYLKMYKKAPGQELNELSIAFYKYLLSVRMGFDPEHFIKEHFTDAECKELSTILYGAGWAFEELWPRACVDLKYAISEGKISEERGADYTARLQKLMTALPDREYRSLKVDA